MEETRTCDCCGKEIKIGDPIYRIPGLIHRCCSKACLLDCYVPTYQVGTYTGEED